MFYSNLIEKIWGAPGFAWGGEALLYSAVDVPKVCFFEKKNES
jgi:hypothetical protein